MKDWKLVLVVPERRLIQGDTLIARPVVSTCVNNMSLPTQLTLLHAHIVPDDWNAEPQQQFST